MPAGKSWRTSRSTPQAAGGQPDQAQSFAVFARDRAGILESRLHRRASPRAARPPRRRPASAGSSRPPSARACGRRRPQATPPGRTSPRPNRLPHNSAVVFRKSPRKRPQYDGGRQKADIAGQGPQVARYGWPAVPAPSAMPRSACARSGGSRTGQRLDRLAIGRRVARSRCRRPASPSVVDRALVGPADQRPLDPAMLVAERDLQVKHVLAMALEAEVPGSMTPACTGPTATSWISSPSTWKIIGHAGMIGSSVRPPPGVVTGPIGAMKADRLEPRMPFGNDPPLLGDFALEPVRPAGIPA